MPGEAKKIALVEVGQLKVDLATGAMLRDLCQHSQHGYSCELGLCRACQ